MGAVHEILEVNGAVLLHCTRAAVTLCSGTAAFGATLIQWPVVLLGRMLL